MIDYRDIRNVHLEISTLCNASCPGCPRTFWGYPYNGGYPEVNLSPKEVKQIFPLDFLQQLDSIIVNGNFGDIVMNPDGANIIEFFVSANPDINVDISTNGGARDRKFWQRLAETGATVTFALDGLADVHHLYRQNTVWDTVIKNATIFIKHGGLAVWQMIVFDHNRHQIDACRKLSEDLGFIRFNNMPNERSASPVFDRSGNLVQILGDYQGNREFKILFNKKLTDEVLLEDIVIDRPPSRSVQCKTQKHKSIYIAANGDVSPCCWTGLYPKTYGHGQYYQAANSQLLPMIHKNNALEYNIRECIEWFAEIEKAWHKKSYTEGRLIICDNNCGSSLTSKHIFN